mmetsp:Transcript_4777/g.11131  ORF Transcript_4777/g.11131 Transcript_4777/m.11131 type:complete len:261 (+) Transcript_4777:1251-2033(+)
MPPPCLCLFRVRSDLGWELTSVLVMLFPTCMLHTWQPRRLQQAPSLSKKPTAPPTQDMTTPQSPSVSNCPTLVPLVCPPRGPAMPLPHLPMLLRLRLRLLLRSLLPLLLQEGRVQERVLRLLLQGLVLLLLLLPLAVLSLAVVAVLRLLLLLLLPVPVLVFRWQRRRASPMRLLLLTEHCPPHSRLLAAPRTCRPRECLWLHPPCSIPKRAACSVPHPTVRPFGPLLAPELVLPVHVTFAWLDCSGPVLYLPLSLSCPRT